MFEREHHRRIARVLEALDPGVLAAAQCWFGGGTAIALRFGEYRESEDIDLITSSRDGYRALRERVTGREGLQALARPGRTLEAALGIRADQYGLRTRVSIDGVEIKLEVVLEARIALDAPGPDDFVCGVPGLTVRDLAATKLLANSDRWADDAVFSRDLIDLAMMKLPRRVLTAALEKARGAYGESIDRDLAKAVAALRARRGRLERCMEALQITSVPKAVLWQRIRALPGHS